MNTRRGFIFVVVACALLSAASASRADTLSQVAVDIGADTFYSHGYDGSGVIIGNVEAGLTRNDHQALPATTVTQQVHWDGVNPTTSVNRVQSHATQVGGTMVAQDNATTGKGIAYGAQLWSGQIATSFGSGGSFSISGNSLLYPLMLFGQIGISSQKADVINSSWGATDDTGNTIINVIYDYLANSQGVTMVVSAGNNGQGAGTVGTPGNSWNVITVGAIGSTQTVTSWSSGGPTGSFNLAGTRTKPDIVAPGLSITMPTTGGSAAYATASGTSFSSPITAAAAALVIDYGKDSGRSTDPRLIKAVLMNSATKLTGWSQQVGYYGTTRINYTPVDGAQGAGALNLTQAWTQYSASTGTGSKPGDVGLTGWDVNVVAQNAPQDYTINQSLHAGQTLTATLIWFMDRTVGNYNAAASNPYPSTTFSNDSFDDLDLLLYKADVNGDPTGDPIVASISGWSPGSPTDPTTAVYGLDSVEHIYFDITDPGDYVLRVRWAGEVFDFVSDAQSENYALAWSVTPEPGTILLLILGGAAILALAARRRPVPARVAA
ncbi:MAG: hypothetical protein BIFFINMI_01633 [Phycisphaerae bacterium]|nr:hypothetical protein [Phycisphaerae bacterium]